MVPLLVSVGGYYVGHLKISTLLIGQAASLVAHPERSIISAWECDLEFVYSEPTSKPSPRHQTDMQQWLLTNSP